MIARWATTRHRFEVSDCNLSTNRGLVSIRAFRAPGPSTCLILWLLVNLCGDSSFVSSLLFSQILLCKLSYFGMMWEFGSMGWGLVHADRCEGLASAYRWCLWPVWAATRVRIFASKRLAWIIRKVALIARIRPTTFIFLAVCISLIIDFPAIYTRWILLLNLLSIWITDASVTFSSLYYDFIIVVGSLPRRLMPHAFCHMLLSLFFLITF